MKTRFFLFSQFIGIVLSLMLGFITAASDAANPAHPYTAAQDFLYSFILCQSMATFFGLCMVGVVWIIEG